MGISVFISVFLHFGLVAIAYLGIPYLRQDVIAEAPIVVEIINVAELTNVPQKQVIQEKKTKTEPPKLVVKAAPKPKPEPVPARKPNEVAIISPPP